ncbi:MAG: hypothetical protein ACOYK8_10155 [Alphaproteobacteria bacterium]
MVKQHLFSALAAFTLLSCFAVTSAHAKKDWSEKEWHHRHREYDDDDRGHYKHYKHYRHYKRPDVIVIDHSDRIIIQEYARQRYYRHCPHGLVETYHGCMAPAYYHRNYVIGRPLEARWEPLPRDLLYQLSPTPVGYRYVMVDRDVLLIAEGSKKVIDAMTLFSAIGR